MFDLITGRATHLPRTQGLPLVLSTVGQVALVGLVVVLPLLWVADQLPEMPTMMAFVAAPPVPPPPPPPPAPVAAARKAPTPPATPPTPGQLVAPIEAPRTIEAEAASEDEGLPGGVEGGVPGGVVGGVVGGLPEAPPPPPPPAPEPARPTGPVRIGGQVRAPALLHRVEPTYPSYLAQARVQGLVILEAVINDAGVVTDVKVLRSVNPLLDREAVLAVRQWRYSPLLLNGTRVPFMLTVTLSFSLQGPTS